MSNLKQRIIESILKDFENIKEFDSGKTLRKERSLLLKRVESAKKLFIDDLQISNELLEIERLIGSFDDKG